MIGEFLILLSAALALVGVSYSIGVIDGGRIERSNRKLAQQKKNDQSLLVDEQMRGYLEEIYPIQGSGGSGGGNAIGSVEPLKSDGDVDPLHRLDDNGGPIPVIIGPVVAPPPVSFGVPIQKPRAPKRKRAKK